MYISQPHRHIERLIRPKVLVISLVLIGLMGVYFSSIIRNPYTVLFPVAIIAGAVTFYLLPDQHTDHEIVFDDRFYKISTVVFFVLLTVLLLQYHVAGFWRTNTIFHLTILLYGVAALTILIKPKVVIGLTLIGIVGLTNRLTAFYASERFAGVDIYGHVELISGVVAEGSLQPFSASKYFYAPVYHLQVAQGELIFGVSTKDALALTTMMAITLLPMLVVFLVTSRFWSTRIGLLSALIFTASDHVIGWSVHLIPTSLGVAMFALVVLTLVDYYLQPDWRVYVVFISTFVALSFTHQVSMFIAGVFTIVFAASVCIYQLRIVPSAIHTSLAAGFITFLDFVVTRYAGPTGEISFFDQVAGHFFSTFLESGPDTRAEVAFPDIAGYSAGGAAAMADIQLIGSTLLLLFAVLGALYWMHGRQGDQHVFVGFALGTSVTVMLVIALGGPVVGMRNLMPGRWWPFIYVIFAIFAGPGLLLTIRSIGTVLGYRPSRDSFVAALVVLVFTGFMVGSATASTDNPYLDEGFSAERYSLTEQEVAIADHVSEFRNSEIPAVTDRRYSSNIAVEFTSSSTITMEYNSPDSIVSDEPTYIINRQYLSQPQANIVLSIGDNQWRVHGGIPTNEVTPQFINYVYTNRNDELWMVER